MSISPFSANYKQPQTQTNYLKFKEEGSYVFRILTPKEKALVYWIDFFQTPDGKFSKKVFPYQENGQKPLEASPEAKLVWVFSILNKDLNKIQIWEVSQRTIQNFLLSITKGKIKNDYTKFDIQITKIGQKLETEYSIIPGDTEILTQEEKELIKLTPINLQAMEKGEDPFLAISPYNKEETFHEDIDLPNIDEIVEKMPF